MGQRAVVPGPARRIDRGGLGRRADDECERRECDNEQEEERLDVQAAVHDGLPSQVTSGAFPKLCSKFIVPGFRADYIPRMGVRVSASRPYPTSSLRT